jgi:hypothetical protein
MTDDRPLTGDNPTPWFKRKRIVIPIALVVLAIIGGATGGNKSATTSSTNSGSAAPTDGSGNRVYPATVDGTAVVDPATVAVRFTVQNNGSQTVSPSCTISLQNAGGSYHGFDVFSMNPIAPGAAAHATGNITITSQGAQYVTQSTISCTASTSDKTVSTGGSVKVLDVADALGAYDPTTGWYWGGVITVSGVGNNTLLKCTETATDASGATVATHTFNAVTFSDGTMTGYGYGADGKPSSPTADTTQTIAKSIKKVTATCSLA